MAYLINDKTLENIREIIGQDMKTHGSSHMTISAKKDLDGLLLRLLEGVPELTFGDTITIYLHHITRDDVTKYLSTIYRTYTSWSCYDDNYWEDTEAVKTVLEVAEENKVGDVPYILLEFGSTSDTVINGEGLPEKLAVTKYLFWIWIDSEKKG